MQKPHDVASLYYSKKEKKLLWKAAIKWPLYSVAVMPVCLAAGWRLKEGLTIRIDQLMGLLINGFINCFMSFGSI